MFVMMTHLDIKMQTLNILPFLHIIHQLLYSTLLHTEHLLHCTVHSLLHNTHQDCNKRAISTLPYTNYLFICIFFFCNPW